MQSFGAADILTPELIVAVMVLLSVHFHIKRDEKGKWTFEAGYTPLNTQALKPVLSVMAAVIGEFGEGLWSCPKSSPDSPTPDRIPEFMTESSGERPMSALSRRFSVPFALRPLTGACPFLIAVKLSFFPCPAASDIPGDGAERAETASFGMSKNLFHNLCYHWEDLLR